MDYEAANKYLKRRLSVATTLGSGGISAAVDAQLRQRCFFSARVAEARVLRALRRISDAHSRGDLSLAEARTLLKRWLDREHPGERDPDDNRITSLGSTARLDLILRQNAAQAAAVGRYEVGMDPDVMDRWPNWRYIAHPDARPTHAVLDGIIRPKTDPLWRRVFPPWDFNCRCDVEDEEGEATDPPGFRIETPESGYRFDPAEALRYSLDDVEDPEMRKIVEEQIRARFRGEILGNTPSEPVKPVSGNTQKVKAGAAKQPLNNENIAKVMKPSGTPVGDALEVTISDKRQREAVNHAIDVINSIHGDGELMVTPVNGRAPGGGALGCFTRWTNYAGKVVQTEIRILKSGDHRSLTATHEIGHLIDAFGLGTGKTTGAELRNTPELKGWWRAITKSKTYQALSELNDQHAMYLRNPKELWARSYAQYIARKSGDKILMEELEKTIKCTYNDLYHAQWDTDDFAPIMEAMDQLFLAKKWIKAT